MATLYFFLIVGALTTLYPFALMISAGLKGPTDQNDNRLVPAYFSSSEDLLKKYIDDKYAGDLGLIASTRGTADGDVARYESFLMSLPNDLWMAGFKVAPNQVTSRLTARYQAWLRKRFPSIEAVNLAYLEQQVDFQTISVPAELFERKTWNPTPSRKWSDWQEFKSELPAEFRIPIRVKWIYQKYVAAKYRGVWADVPANVKRSAKRFEELEMPTGPELAEFRAKGLPERYERDSVEQRWTAIAGAEPQPIEAFERSVAAKNSPRITREFAWRNYAYVLDYILLNGHAVVNTAIFCLLAIVTQLTVNPLAAYALSRYPIRASGQILLFLLATMAFPAEVAMIPSFLLLRDLGLLNTFAALVLPGAASGYMIFLLKGFFDSLPQELFEAAQLDGAPESTMMLRIAFPMSRPVLGYLALLAFMGAYGAFIYAFLVAQDQRIWTLMVWVYQLQGVAPRPVIMAALTLAALPTLLVFLFTQRVIMRGIVLPGER